MEDDFLDGLEYLEEFKLKGLPGLGLPRVGNFLSPFANDAAGPLKNVILDCKTCDFSSLQLGTVTSLERFELIDVSKPPSVHLSKWLLFPPSIRHVKLKYGNSLQWLCDEYQKVKQQPKIMTNTISSSYSVLKLQLWMNYESFSTYECEGMMDTFFTLPPPVLSPTIAPSTPVITSSSGLDLKEAYVNSALVHELLNRTWGSLYISGGWAIPQFWFPESASKIGAHIDFSYLGTGMDPMFYVSFNCISHMCTSFSFTSSASKLGSLKFYNLKPHQHGINSSITSYANTLGYVKLENLFTYVRFPFLENYMEGNSSGDYLFLKTVKPKWRLFEEQHNVQNISLICKENLDNAKVHILRKRAYLNYDKLSHLSLFCEVSAIEQNALAHLPLESLTIRTSGFNERALPTVFPLLGPRATKAKRIHFDGLLTPNVTMPLYHDSVRDSFFTHYAILRNGRLKEFNINSLGSPICNNTLGLCNGLQLLDVSFNNLSALDFNWAKSFEINSLKKKNVEQQLFGNNMCTSLGATCSHIRINDDLIPPVQASIHSSRNLSGFYSMFQDWEKEYERPISIRRTITIDIRSNRLEKLAEGSFANLRSLSVVCASQNKIRSLEPGFLQGKSCLASGCVVDLRNNTLGDDMESLSRNLTLQAQMGTPVTAIALSGNSLRSFPFGVGKFLLNGNFIWGGMSKPNFYVDLGHNNITHISASVCSGMPPNASGVYVVDLSHNDIVEVSGDAFSCPVDVDLHVYLNDNRRLRAIPGDAKFLKSLVSLDLINTGVNTDNIPYVYETGKDERDERDNKLRLRNLGLGQTVDHGELEQASASVRSFDCCFFVQLKRHYCVLGFNKFPPSMWNSDPSFWNSMLFASFFSNSAIYNNAFDPESESYVDFQCTGKRLAPNGDSSVRSFKLFLKDYLADKSICKGCGESEKESFSLLCIVYTCIIALYIALHIVAIKTDLKPSEQPIGHRRKSSYFTFLRIEYGPVKPHTPGTLYKNNEGSGGEERYVEFLKHNGNLDYSEPADALYVYSSAWSLYF
eukprot:Nk52_evm20s503 gene=Nk52_evmTU20s503